jgi:hypothetical protein
MRGFAPMQTRTATYCILTPERRLSEFFSTAFGRLGGRRGRTDQESGCTLLVSFSPKYLLVFFSSFISCLSVTPYFGLENDAASSDNSNQGQNLGG